MTADEDRRQHALTWLAALDFAEKEARKMSARFRAQGTDPGLVAGAAALDHYAAALHQAATVARKEFGL